jgi:hypothetical protein
LVSVFLILVKDSLSKLCTTDTLEDGVKLGISEADLGAIIKEGSGYELKDIIYTNEKAVTKQKDRIYNAKGYPAPWKDPLIIEALPSVVETCKKLFVEKEKDPVFVHRGFKALYTREDKDEETVIDSAREIVRRTFDQLKLSLFIIYLFLKLNSNSFCLNIILS